MLMIKKFFVDLFYRLPESPLLRKPYLVLRIMVKSYFVNRVPASSAQLAYYFIFSFFPLLLFINAVIGRFQININEMLNIAENILPTNINELLKYYVDFLAESNSAVMMTTGAFLTIYSVSRAANSLFYTINKAYSITDIQSFLKRTALSAVFSVVLIILIVFAIASMIFGTNFFHTLDNIVPIAFSFIWMWQWFRFVIIGLFFFLVLTLLYYIIPNKKIRLRTVFPGVVFTFIAEVLVSFGFSIYVVNYTNYNAIYGFWGALLLLALWLYLSGFMIILGGELNSAVYKVYFGERTDDGLEPAIRL